MNLPQSIAYIKKFCTHFHDMNLDKTKFRINVVDMEEIKRILDTSLCNSMNQKILSTAIKMYVLCFEQ